MTHIASMVKRLAASAMFAACLAGAAAAQAPQAPQGQRPAPPGNAVTTNCTDVQVGSAQSYNCINAQLGAVARGTARYSSDADAPITASSPSNQVGTFNESATRERLGPNFGHSVTPYRPTYVPPPTIATPR